MRDTFLAWYPPHKNAACVALKKARVFDVRCCVCLWTGEKGFEPLTFGFGDHCSTVGTTLLCVTHSLRPFRLLVRTSLFHGEETGSIPVGDMCVAFLVVVRVHATIAFLARQRTFQKYITFYVYCVLRTLHRTYSAFNIHCILFLNACDMPAKKNTCMGFFLLSLVSKILGLVVPLLVAVAYLTLAERKVMASMQRRKGPNVVGFFGILQPLADGLKLLIKEPVLPSSANTVVFLAAPVVTFLLALIAWAVIPFGEGMVLCDLDVGMLYIFAVSSLGVYGVIMAGWSSNSKYAFLGALRSTAQMVSYEVSLGLIIIAVVMCVGSLNLSSIVLAQQDVWFIVPLFPLMLLFFISCLAETNRAPFDLPEAEAELVAGYNVEYSSMGFALFFLGEYANMIMMSTLCVILFLGGWLPPFSLTFLYWIPGSMWLGLKTIVFLFLYIWVRAAFPRYRYDQLMRLGWKVFLPLALAWVLFVAGVLVAFNILPS